MTVKDHIVTDQLRCYGGGDQGDSGIWSGRNVGAGSTTGPKTHTSHFDDERAR